MKFLNLEIKRTKAINTNPKVNESFVNNDQVNKLYEQLTRLMAKGQFVWNKNDFKNIIENGYLFNPDIYAIINKIIQTASMVGYQVYDIKDKKTFRQYINYKKVKNTEATFEFQRKSMEAIGDHPVLSLLEQPNQYSTGTVFDQNMLGYYLLLGNSYLNKVVIAGNPSGKIGELQILPAYMVKIILGTASNIVDGYSIDCWNNLKYKFTPEEIYHFKSFNPDYEVGQFMYGAMPSTYPTMQKSNDSYTAAVSLIQNLGVMGMLSTGDDKTLDPEQAQLVRTKYQDNYSGPKNRGKILVVGQKMDFVNMATSIIDMNLIAGQEQDFLTLCRVYGVDPRIMGFAKYSSYNNMQECKKDFVQNRVLPLKYMQSEAYNKFLMPAFNKEMGRNLYIDVDTNAIPELQVDMNTLSTRLQNEVKCGLITPAEASRILGYDSTANKEADQLFISTSMIPLKKPEPVTVPPKTPPVV